VKGSFLLSAFLLLLPIAAAAQVTRPAATAAQDAPDVFLRYEAFGGVDYSGANQVKSSAALIGGNVGVSAKLVKWFGGTVDFGDYATAATNNGLVKPNQTTFLAGPEFYIPADSLTGFIHVMFGGAHTGGVTGTPNIAFAYAIGGGFEYAFNKHLALRITGDGIRSSFQQETGGVTYDSAHPHTNARASAGIAWHF